MSVELFEVRVTRGRPPHVALLVTEGNSENYTEGFLIAPEVEKEGEPLRNFAMAFRGNILPERARAIAMARLGKLVWDLNVDPAGAVERVEFSGISHEWLSAQRAAGLYPDFEKLSRKSRVPSLHTFLSHMNWPSFIDIDL
ncbi:hypothetical protein JVX96_24375 [Variovorax sp. PDNC026]|uniref:hypothetical protein n=1 Tax=Variovorax sp. PDNC026 TaxID=2811425 RepID=UPI001964A583|nr:hypothetical protein [Variovorax sp. PDNC026]QRY31183.1 hypothetical protein JVX96_24375 [Variovorax sp. PDNC026]